MSDDTAAQQKHSGLATWIRRLAVPIILGWVVAVAVLNAAVPQLEAVGAMRSVQMTPDFAPSVIASGHEDTSVEGWNRCSRANWSVRACAPSWRS